MSGVVSARPALARICHLAFFECWMSSPEFLGRSAELDHLVKESKKMKVGKVWQSFAKPRKSKTIKKLDPCLLFLQLPQRIFCALSNEDLTVREFVQFLQFAFGENLQDSMINLQCFMRFNWIQLN